VRRRADNDRDGDFDCAGDDDVGDDDAGDDDAGDDDAGDDDAGDDDAGDDDAGDDDAGDDDAGDDDTFVPGDPWPAAVFSPFVDASLYPVMELGPVSAATGVDFFALGFVVSDPAAAGGCTGSWGTYYSIDAGPDSWGPGGQYFLYDHIDAVQADGDVIVSFGGASNSPLAATCTDTAALVDEYTRVIDRLDLVAVDFDIEGYWVEDTASVERRNTAIAQLQTRFAAASRPLAVWYTLPVLQSGLVPSGVALLDDALSRGVDVAGVNIMTMDYGDGAAPKTSGQMGEYAIDAAEALHGQLTTLYANHGIPATSEQLWAKVGMTPMIGLNDVVTETFDLTDMQQVTDFAALHDIGMLSMWSLNRDHPCPEASWVQLTCSSTADQSVDWEFSAIGATYGP
jgi:hypothetical protein